MSKKPRRTVKPVYVAEDFNIENETKNDLPEAVIASKANPEAVELSDREEVPIATIERKRQMSHRREQEIPPEQTIAEKPRSYSPRNMIVGVNPLSEARSKEELLRFAGFQLNHAITSRDSNYFHVTSKNGREAYIKTPIEENVFDSKKLSPRTRGFLIPAKKTTAVHYSLDEREKILESCKQHCHGVVIRNKHKSSLTFVDSTGYDTHFFNVDSDIPLPIIHIDEIVQNEETIHTTIEKAVSLLEGYAMDLADKAVDSFLEQFSELRKSVHVFSKECDEIVSAYIAFGDDLDAQGRNTRQDLITKFLKMTRKIEATRGVFLELQQIIEESTQ